MTILCMALSLAIKIQKERQTAGQIDRQLNTEINILKKTIGVEIQ